MPVVIKDYPKWVDGVLYQTAEDEAKAKPPKKEKPLKKEAE